MPKADLVLHLRAAADWKYMKPYRDAELFCQAADRIQALEAALRELASDNYHIDDYQQIASRALEG